MTAVAAAWRWAPGPRFRRRVRASIGVVLALIVNLVMGSIPARADTFDDVIEVMSVIDTAAPGALPFTAQDLKTFRTILQTCGSASSTDAVLQCVDVAASTDAAIKQGVPSWLPQLIAVYFDIEHHDYWGLLADAGEAAACAAGEILTGVDVCGVIQTIYDAAKDVAEGAKIVADAVEAFFSDLGSAVESLGCDVASLWGGCDGAPPPPDAATTANAICGSRGGVAGLLSHANTPDDVSFQCGDGTQCVAKPGKGLSCQTPEQKAAAEKQRVAQNTLDFATKPQQWAEQLEAKWLPQCADEQCRIGVRFVKTGVLALAQQRHGANPDYGWAEMGLDLLQADKQAQQLVNESQTRKLLAEAKTWGDYFDAKWLPQCADDQCRLGVKFVHTGTALSVQQKLNANPNLPAAALAPLYVAADTEAQQLVSESQSRAFNAKTSTDAAEGWKQIAIGVYTKQCQDLPCLAEVNALGEQFRLAIIKRQALEPNESSLHIQGEVNKVYGPLFKAAVDKSIARQKAAPPPAPALRPPV